VPFTAPTSRLYHFPPVRISPLQARIAPRGYSTEAEAKDGESAEAAITGASEAKDEDPTKKELEAKNREIIDLKVRPPSQPSSNSAFSYLNPSPSLG